MSSFKLNIAHIRGCPSPRNLLEAIKDFGSPRTEEFGVLDCSSSNRGVYATIVRKIQQTLSKFDAKTSEVNTVTVEKAITYPFAVRPKLTLDVNMKVKLN